MITTRRRRLIATAAAAGVAAFALSACSGGSSGDADDGRTTVEFWTWNPDQATAVSYIEAFEEEHPDITIDHRFIQYSDYVNTTQVALTSGSGPDVFGLQVGALTEQFAPLAEDLAPYLEDTVGSDWSDQLTATDQLSVDDKQVGVPWMITGGGIMWANQTLVDSLGLTVPSDADELATFCSAVQDSGRSCLVQGARDAWQNIDVYQTIMNQIAPGEFYDAIVGDKPFDGADFVEGFSVWQSLFDDGVFQEGALGATAYPDANDAFKQGDAALIAFGTWQNGDTTATRLAQYSETYGDDALNTTIFMPYSFPVLVDGGTASGLFGGPDVGFGVAASSSEKEAAATFALWLASSEASQSLMARSVQQPALQSIPLDLADVVDDQQRAALEAQGPALADLIGPREISNADVQTALGDALSAVASGQQTPGDAAASVNDAITAAG